MSRDKQIEEIKQLAKDIFAPKVALDGIDLAFASVHGADMEDSHFMRIAKHLYGKGYRKASDVENAIYAAIKKDFSLAIERLKKAKLNLIGDMRIYADGKLSAYQSFLFDLPHIIKLYKESEGADDDL